MIWTSHGYLSMAKYAHHRNLNCGRHRVLLASGFVALVMGMSACGRTAIETTASPTSVAPSGPTLSVPTATPIAGPTMSSPTRSLIATPTPAPSSTLIPTTIPNQSPTPTLAQRPTSSPTATLIEAARPTVTATAAPGRTPNPTFGPTPTPAPTPRFPACSDEPVFTVSPTDFASIDHIVTLGNLNPPGHTFPTAHIYFYVTNPDPKGVTDITTLYSPGSMTVVAIRADEHVTAGFTDYSIALKPCEEITAVLGHVSSLSAALFGEPFPDGERTSQEGASTGGETYRTQRKNADIKVRTGEVLGTVGGNPGIWAWDLGVNDQRV